MPGLVVFEPVGRLNHMRFEPPELRDQLRDAIGAILPGLHHGVSPFADETGRLLSDAELDELDLGIDVITDEFELEDLCFDYSDDYFTLTVADLIHIPAFLKAAQLIDRTTVLSDSLALVHVVPVNDKAHSLLYAETPANFNISERITLPEGDCSVRLVFGVTPFAFFLAATGDVGKEVPAYTEDDTFVKLLLPAPLPIERVRDICDTFLYELSSSYKVDFRPQAYPEAFYGWDELEVADIRDPDTDEFILRLRPLDLSHGMVEVNRLFSRPSMTAMWSIPL